MEKFKVVVNRCLKAKCENREIFFLTHKEAFISFSYYEKKLEVSSRFYS